MRRSILCALAVVLSPASASGQAEAFRLTVQDVFTITDEGTVITGIVEGGPVAVGDVICLRPADGEGMALTVDAILDIRRRRQEVESAEPGTIVGLRFGSLEQEAVEAGDTLTADCDQG